MSVTAKFLADFSSFEQAVDRAEVSLKDFSRATLTVDRDLTKLATSFSGQKILQEATLAAKAVESVGGASKLTEAEQARLNATMTEAIAKYRALGIEAPKSIKDLEAATRSAEETTSAFAGTFAQLTAAFTVGNLIDRGVSSLIAFGKEAFESASHIADLSDKTGLTTATIQRMMAVADQTGTSVDAFSQAAFKLGVNISGGDKSVVKALTELGLSWNAVKGLKMDEQWDLVTDALGKVDTAQERNKLGVDLFGKKFAEIAPAIAEGYSEIAGQARVAGDAQIHAADTAGDAWSLFVRNRKAELTEGLGDFVLAGQKIGDSWKVALLAFAVQGPLAIETLAKMKAAEADLTAEHQKNIDVSRQLGKETDDLTEHIKKQTNELHLSVDQTEKFAQIRKQAFGLDDVEKVKDMITAIHGIEGVTRMSADAMKDFHKELTEASAAAERNGKDIPETWALIWEATARATGGVKEYFAALQAVKGAAEQITPPVDAFAEAARLAAAQEAAMKEEIKNSSIIIESAADAHTKAGDAAVDATSRAMAGYASLNGVLSATVQLSQGVTEWSEKAWEATDGFRQLHQAGYGGEDPTPFKDWQKDWVKIFGHLPGFAGGTDGYKNFGTGTPVMLHGWEKVTPIGKGDGGATVIVNIDARESFYDSAYSLNKLADKVSDAVRQSLAGKGARF